MCNTNIKLMEFGDSTQFAHNFAYKPQKPHLVRSLPDVALNSRFLFSFRKES